VQAIAPVGVTTELYGGLATLPHFNPDHEGPRLPEPVAHLRAQIRAADAVLLSTPEYAGALPGSCKNLLDWTVGRRPSRSLNGKPVAWINAAPRGAVLAHDSRRHVLGYVGAVVVEPACVAMPLTREEIGPDGLIVSSDLRRTRAATLDELVAVTTTEPAAP
jgi:chromate reductase